MKILAVCRGTAEVLEGTRYKTGIVKNPVTGPVLVDSAGVIGDAICNKKHHGGVDQAIYIEGKLTLDWWESELDHPIPPGFFGENLLIDGLDNRDLVAGDTLSIGNVILEITAPRIPCLTFGRKMGDPGFVRRYSAAARPGGYARVLSGGWLEAGLDVVVTAYKGERVCLAELMTAFSSPPTEPERRRYLSAPISERMRARLTGR